MKKLTYLAALIAAGTTTTACSTLKGAGIGGAAGAGVAAVSDGNVKKGAVAGAAAGAVVGTVVD